MNTKNILKKVGVIACTVVITALLTSGIMTYANSKEAQKIQETTAGQSETVSTNLPAQNLENATDSYISEAKAIEIALIHAGLSETDVSYMFSKLDYDNGTPEYEIEFWDGTTEYDYEINAVTGDIIGYDYDMENYDAKSISTPNTADSSNYIGEAKAIEIALANAGITESEAGYIKCEFDFDDGAPEYEVEWQIGRVEYDYTISATDGTIFKRDVDYD